MIKANNSLRPSDIWVQKKERANRRRIADDTENSKSFEKKETDCLNDTLPMVYLLLVNYWLI